MTAAATSHAPSGWADLPPDLLGDVSGRLHDAIDFTRFHAVCTPWREALLCQNAPRRAFLPYLVTPCKHLILRSTVDFGSVDTSESDTTCRRSCEDVVFVQRPYAILTGYGDSGERNWVACGDGSAAWIFSHRMLHNVLTGGVINLPLLPEPMRDRKFKPRMEDLRGIVYGDGTIFLYSIYDQYNGMPAIAAAILPAGGTLWTFEDKELRFYTRCSGHSVAAYHDGKILVCVDWHHRYVLNLDDSGSNNHVLQSWCIQNTEHKYRDDCFYVLESECELLLVSILVKQDWSRRNADDNTAHAMSLRVHALEEQDEGGKVRWVARDGQRLGDRVLFLGSPASFAMDATQLGMDGGCAYFVFKGGLFKYRFINDEAKLVTLLHPIWSANMTCVWLQPRPHFRPSGKKIETPNKKNQKVGRAEAPWRAAEHHDSIRLHGGAPWRAAKQHHRNSVP